MGIIDAHLHVMEHPSLDGEFNLAKLDIFKAFRNLSMRVADAGLDKAIVHILDEKVIMDESVYNSFLKCNNQNLFFSIRLPSNIDNLEEFLQKANISGIRGIKILPYEDYITEDKYDYYLYACKMAEKLGFIITVCCTYGSKYIYEVNNLALAKHIADNVNTTVVLAHAGGARVLDAMSIALDLDNIMMDLAFSLSYWKESTVIQDIAFCIKKVGAERFLFGSDGPHIGIEEAINVADTFLDANNFLVEDKNKIFYENAQNLVEKFWKA